MSRLYVCLTVLAVILASGQGILAVHENLGCSDCHIIHGQRSNATSGQNDPIWNPAQMADGLPTFTLYSSQTFDALNTDITQPDGASRLCLGCHDGSYSDLNTRDGGRLKFGPADLARMHPISFTYDTALASRSVGLKDPNQTMSGLGGTISRDLLDGRNKVQCSSCHDMHSTGKGRAMLRYDYNPATGSDVIFCRTCHNR